MTRALVFLCLRLGRYATIAMHAAGVLVLARHCSDVAAYCQARSHGYMTKKVVVFYDDLSHLGVTAAVVSSDSITLQRTTIC